MKRILKRLREALSRLFADDICGSCGQRGPGIPTRRGPNGMGDIGHVCFTCLENYGQYPE